MDSNHIFDNPPPYAHVVTRDNGTRHLMPGSPDLIQRIALCDREIKRLENLAEPNMSVDRMIAHDRAVTSLYEARRTLGRELLQCARRLAEDWKNRT